MHYSPSPSPREKRKVSKLSSWLWNLSWGPINMGTSLPAMLQLEISIKPAFSPPLADWLAMRLLFIIYSIVSFLKDSKV